MKIGIMLRHMDQHSGGVRVYTQNLLRQLLEINTSHQFIFMYRDPRYLGSFNNLDQVREVAVKAPSLLLWDQLAVPRIEHKENLDIVLNLKSTVPIVAKAPTVLVCHGLDKSLLPGSESWANMMNYQYVMPIYMKKAKAIIAISNVVKEGLIDYFGLDKDRIHTVYHGVDDSFRQPIQEDRLAKTQKTYNLPERFFLYCGQIYPPKNFGRLLQAYAKVGPALGISLVVAGEHRWRSEGEIALANKLGIADWIKWPGWIEHDVLPDFYHLAQALVLPSLYESCGIPILEALSAGCPVVTSNCYGTAEMAGDAAVLVDPEQVDSIADGMRRIVTDQSLRQQMIERGYERSKFFTWRSCALDTLRVLESVQELHHGRFRAV